MVYNIIFIIIIIIIINTIFLVHMAQLLQRSDDKWLDWLPAGSQKSIYRLSGCNKSAAAGGRSLPTRRCRLLKQYN